VLDKHPRLIQRKAQASGFLRQGTNGSLQSISIGRPKSVQGEPQPTPHPHLDAQRNDLMLALQQLLHCERARVQWGQLHGGRMVKTPHLTQVANIYFCPRGCAGPLWGLLGASVGTEGWVQGQVGQLHTCTAAAGLQGGKSPAPCSPTAAPRSHSPPHLHPPRVVHTKLHHAPVLQLSPVKYCRQGAGVPPEDNDSFSILLIIMILQRVA